MTKVMPSLIAYIATQVIVLFSPLMLCFSEAYLPCLQVQFALSLSPVFSRMDTITDSERFYNSVLDLLDDIEEQEQVNDLLTW